MRPSSLITLALSSSLLLGTGCVARGKARFAAYATDALVVTAGVAMASVDPVDRSDDLVNTTELRHQTINLGIVLATVGVLAFGATYIIEDRHPTPTPPVTPREALDTAFLDPIPAPPGADPGAVRLTLQARNAAVGGSCTAVRMLEPRVAAADRGYYLTVFVRDQAIAACL